VAVWTGLLLGVAASPPPSPSCGLYGQPPCQFLPAPPGCTPACAKPGDTYCENVKNYPGRLIKQLIVNYDVRNMIVDETSDELFLHTLKGHDHFQPLFGVAVTPATYDVDAPYTYGPPTHYGESHDTGNYYQQQPQHGNYIYRPQRASHYGNQYQGNPSNNFPYRRIYNRRFQRSITSASLPVVTNGTAEKIVLDTEGLPATAVHHNRTKRQIAFGREQLCQTRSQFVQPQAALNKQGNWMYVVNQGNDVTQLVKTEVCASNICSNLCQLPTGYNSRCEQKYVQKRLVALQMDGQRLYTDTFWFPSCCVCTIGNQ